MRPGLRGLTGSLSEEELQILCTCALKILTAAANEMFVNVRAADLEQNLIRNDAPAFTSWLRQRQKQLPQMPAEVEVSASWVNWTVESTANWAWMHRRCTQLFQAFADKAGHQHPLFGYLRLVHKISPRPRHDAARTRFPEEPC